MRTVSDKAENLRHARELIDEAAKNGADLCVLPEMFCCEYRNRSFIENQEPAAKTPGVPAAQSSPAVNQTAASSLAMGAKAAFAAS